MPDMEKEHTTLYPTIRMTGLSFDLLLTLILPLTSFSTKLSTATFEGAQANTWKILSQ